MGALVVAAVGTEAAGLGCVAAVPVGTVGAYWGWMESQQVCT